MRSSRASRAASKVALAMSGGVDSTVAAKLLLEAGHEVEGFFMRNWDSSDEAASMPCPLDADRDDMVCVCVLLPQLFPPLSTTYHRSNAFPDTSCNTLLTPPQLDVCRRLGIKGHVVDFSRDYWMDVFVPFLESYATGRETPNPDVFCNRHVKVRFVCLVSSCVVRRTSLALYLPRLFLPRLPLLPLTSTPSPPPTCTHLLIHSLMPCHAQFAAFQRYIADTHEGFERMATGHYAGIGAWGGARRSAGGAVWGATASTTPTSAHDCEGDGDGDGDSHLPFLMQGTDRNKDQSYFLSLTRVEHLTRTLFPLAHLTKEEVRGIAHAAPELRGRCSVSHAPMARTHPPSHAHSLIPHPHSHARHSRALSKKESMGICFVGKRPLPGFFGGYIHLTPGRFVDVDSGVSIGAHGGMETLTLGQRARVGGQATPHYVIARPSTDDPLLTTLSFTVQPGDVLVARSDTHPLLYSRSAAMPASGFNWIAPPPAALYRCSRLSSL
jgi:tRNA U34 2-thiouridine synthase MnmA/TrmU